MQNEERKLNDRETLLKRLYFLRESLISLRSDIYTQKESNEINETLDNFIDLMSEILQIPELDYLYENAIEVKQNIADLRKYKITIFDFSKRIDNFIKLFNSEINLVKNRVKADKLFYFFK